MHTDTVKLERLARQALLGTDAHVGTREIFSGLDWQAAGAKPPGVPHSAYELLKHMSYWQDWVVAWLQGRSPELPGHAARSWPAKTGPAGPHEWNAAPRQFRTGLGQLARACRGADLASRRGRKSRLEMLHAIGAHNSYHAGQVVFLRRLLGRWPPPSGGLTW